MPGADFFRNLGLFVVDDFLDRRLCEGICAEMRCSAVEQGAIVVGNGEEVVDENSRRVLRAKVGETSKRLIKDRLEDLKPSLAGNFKASLGVSENPQFLMYNPGGFYCPHTDRGPDTHLSTKDRRISVVVFLNRGCDQVAQDCYGGGQLTFYGILDEPPWNDCAFSLDTTPGLLVAFPSNLIHEVRLVAFGQRFTIATWFLADESGPRASASSCIDRVPELN